MRRSRDRRHSPRACGRTGDSRPPDVAGLCAGRPGRHRRAARAKGAAVRGAPVPRRSTRRGRGGGRALGRRPRRLSPRSRRTGWAPHRPGPAPRLSLIETLAVELAATVERDAMAGRAVAYVQAPLGGSRPTVGLLAAAFGRLAPPSLGVGDILLTGAALRSGLLSLTTEGAPLPERAVAVPLHLCVALDNRDGAPAGATIGVDPGAVVPLPPSTLAEVQRQAAALAATPGRVLVVRSGSLLEARSIAAAIAGALSVRAAFLDPERATGAGPWLVFRRLLPVFAKRGADAEGAGDSRRDAPRLEQR